VINNNNAIDQQVGGDHYKKMPIQPLEFSLVNNLNGAQTKIIKYITRNKAADDYQKAIHVIEYWLEVRRCYTLPFDRLQPTAMSRISTEFFIKENSLCRIEAKVIRLIVNRPSDENLGLAIKMLRDNR